MIVMMNAKTPSLKASRRPLFICPSQFAAAAASARWTLQNRPVDRTQNNLALHYECSVRQVFLALRTLSASVLASAKFVVQIPVLFEWLENNPVKITIDRPVGRFITI